jgi:hypothetical protein
MEYLVVDGKALQCAGYCYAPAEYAVVALATDVPRVAIIRKSTFEHSCQRIVLSPLGGAPFHVTTDPTLKVESAWLSSNPADCDSVSPAMPAGATVPVDVAGGIILHKNNGQCSFDVDVSMYPQNSASRTDRLIANGLPSQMCAF